MSVQILQVVKTPFHILLSVLIATVYSFVLLYLDQFIFLAPYLVIYVPSARAENFVLDVSLALLTGIVLMVSIGEIRMQGSGPSRFLRSGVIGVLVATFAGACPCYYMFPLLAMAGGLGSALGAIGILLNAYQVPAKVVSLTMLGLVIFGLERTLRSQCNIPVGKNRRH